MAGIFPFLPVVGNLLQGAAGLAGSIVANRGNMKLARYQYSRDLEMWQKANEYNSPKAQMARLAEAGLNPNMVYGTGSVTGNTSGATPKFQAPNVNYDTSGFNFGGMLGQYTNLKMAQQDMRSKQINNDMLDKENQLKGLQLLAATKYYLLNSKNEYKIKNYGAASAEAKAGIDIMNYRRGIDTYDQSVLGTNAKFKTYQSQYLNTLMDNQIKTLIRDLKQKELDFLNRGGRYISPVLQGAKMIFGK